jgi:hypothetical protein
MEKICVDGDYFDPYYILQVTPDDSDEQLAKSFRAKARKYHPDKAPLEKKEEYATKFKIVLECYEHITSRRANSIKVVHDDTAEKVIFNQNDVDAFNKRFDEAATITPNSFGYGEHKRLEIIEEYDEFVVPCVNQFENKKFSADDFNAMFEYNKTKFEEAESNAVIHKTTDGFYGYNTADTGSCAAVSSYNGLLAVGDDYGQSGVGYSATGFSDYKQSFSASKNPDKLIQVPDEFLKKKETDFDLTKKFEEYAKQRKSMVTRSEKSLTIQESHKQFLDKSRQSLIDKEESDKKFVMKYAGQFKEKLVKDAVDGKLETSPSLLGVIDQHFAKQITEK